MTPAEHAVRVAVAEACNPAAGVLERRWSWDRAMVELMRSACLECGGYGGRHCRECRWGR